MKKLFTLIMTTALTISVFAQAPQKMSYQFVVRNASGALVTNHAVGMKISILQGSATGTVVFSETYSPNPQTNANGLVSIEIGGGIPITGTFSSINWAGGSYYLKTETDPTGGTNYTVVGTSQLLSVPYALHAKSAETAADAVKITGDQSIAGVKTFTGTIDANNKIITNIASPLTATDAANKAYVDALSDKVLQLQTEIGAKDIDGNIYKAVKIGNQV
jgi:hypothetical protein